MSNRQRDRKLLGEIGSRIRERRRRLGLTQADVSEALGMEPEAISRMETGAVSIPLTTLFRLAVALRVAAAELIAVDAPREGEQSSDLDELVRLYLALDETGRRAASAAVRGIAQEWKRPVPTEPPDSGGGRPLQPEDTSAKER